MKRLLLFIAGAMFLATAHAAVQAPLDTEGHTLPTIDWVGASPCVVDNALGVTAIGCSTGTAIVYGVIISSVAQNNWLVFRDSNTANITSSTVAIITPTYQTGTSTYTVGSTIVIKFPVPLKFNNGVSVNAGIATNSDGRWTILYRPRSTTAASE